MRAPVALLAVLSPIAPAAAACSSSDFTLKANLNPSGRESYRVVGEVISKCAEPASVELQATLRNKAGDVISNDTFHPAGTRNIPPNGRQPFDYPVIPSGGRAETLDLVIIDVRRR